MYAVYTYIHIGRTDECTYIQCHMHLDIGLLYVEWGRLEGTDGDDGDDGDGDWDRDLPYPITRRPI